MKRRLFKLVLFLLIGAIVNVAVAWGCALWMTAIAFDFVVVDETVLWHADGYSHAAGSLRRPASLIINYSNTEMTLQEFNEYLTRPLVAENTKRMDQSSFPSGSLPLLIWQSPSKPSYRYGWDIANGWPFLALRLHMSLTYDGFVNEEPPLLHDGIKLSTSKEPITSSNLTGRALPLHPIWPGFANNTLFYATILWLVTLAPFTARRMIRRKRGRCLKCGYDLRGEFVQGCPECGWGRETEA